VPISRCRGVAHLAKGGPRRRWIKLVALTSWRARPRRTPPRFMVLVGKEAVVIRSVR
jgi:hypothetical protein